jgi:hypothetical protein
LNAIAVIEIVGGPPIITIGPAGMQRTTVTGSTSDLATAFFLSRGIAGMPMSWQERTGSPRNDCGSPSTMTVELPMKISDSFDAGLAKGPPMGMCGGVAWPFVPA